MIPRNTPKYRREKRWVILLNVEQNQNLFLNTKHQSSGTPRTPKRPRLHDVPTRAVRRFDSDDEIPEAEGSCILPLSNREGENRSFAFGPEMIEERLRGLGNSNERLEAIALMTLEVAVAIGQHLGELVEDKRRRE